MKTRKQERSDLTRKLHEEYKISVKDLALLFGKKKKTIEDWILKGNSNFDFGFEFELGVFKDSNFEEKKKISYVLINNFNRSREGIASILNAEYRDVCKWINDVDRDVRHNRKQIESTIETLQLQVESYAENFSLSQVKSKPEEKPMRKLTFKRL